MSEHGAAGNPEQDTDLDIAVVGMAARFGGAEDVQAFWDMLVEGREAVRDIEPASFLAAGGREAELHAPDLVLRRAAIDGIDRFDAEYFGVSPADAQTMDPQHRLFLEAAHRALEHAGHDPEAPDRVVGVYAGAGVPSYLLRNVLPWHTGPDAHAEVMAMALASAPSTLATRVAYLLGLTGPAMTVATACSTSLVAVHLACQDLIGLRTDLAIAGGATLNPASALGYRWVDGGLMSRDGRCRAFDAAADGIVGGDGVAAVVLKRLSDALADRDAVYAVIAGSAVNNDGRRKVGFAAPSAQGQAEVIVAAHAAAGVRPEDVDYVEAHGTGTRVGDPVEVAALTAAFGTPAAARTGECGLGAVKSNIGHTDTAAGAAGLIKTVLALHRERIPATLHHTEANPLIDFAAGPFRVVTEPQPWPRGSRPRVAGVSSFGIGGTNAHVVLREAPRPAPRPDPARDDPPARDEPQLLLVSARSAEALVDSCAQLAGHLRAHPGLDLGDVARTLDEGRRSMPFRAAVLAPSRWATEATAELLAARAEALAANPVRPSRSARPVVLLYGGAGVVPAEAVRELSSVSPPFAAALTDAGRALAPLLGVDLVAALREGRVPDGRQDPAGLSSAAVVAVEFALTALLADLGVRPATVLGHSLGEYAAAAVAGVLGQADTLATVVHRQRLLDAAGSGGVGGAEAVLAAPEDLGSLPEGLYLSVRTGPSSCVVSGSRAALDAWLGGLGEEVAHRTLPAGYAVHSPLLEPARPRLRELLAGQRWQPPQPPWVSTVTGAVADETRARDVDAWVGHSIGPVDFGPALRAAAGRTRPAFVEVGPGRALARATRELLGEATPAVALLPGPKASAVPALLESLGALWCAGVDLRLAPLRPADARMVALPGHPWRRRRFWIDPPAVTSAPAGGAGPGQPADRPEIDPTTGTAVGPGGDPSNGARPIGPGPRPSAGLPRPALSTPYVAPSTEAQRRLVDLCASALGFDRVGLDDDVFTLGADSLSALRLVQRVRAELGAGPGLREFLDDPRVCTLTRSTADNPRTEVS